MNTTRDKRGRFKRKARRTLRFTIVIILAILAYSNRDRIATIANKAPQNVQVDQTILKNSEIDAIQSEASFKARMANQAEQILLQRKIDDVSTQIADLTAKREVLENDLAQKRTESLSL